VVDDVVDDGDSVPTDVRRGDYLPGNDAASSNFPFPRNGRIHTSEKFAGFAHKSMGYRCKIAASTLHGRVR
jgi:hypothetical protein